MQQKEDAANAFQVQEKRMRQVARELMIDEKAAAKGEDYGHAAGPETDSTKDSPQAQPKFIAGNSSGASASAGTKSLSSRPAWALTEKAADDVTEAKELDDPEGLLEFAQGLDFDKYIGDLEVQSMMARLKQRIADMEREMLQDDKREIDAEERAARREMLALMVNIFLFVLMSCVF